MYVSTEVYGGDPKIEVIQGNLSLIYCEDEDSFLNGAQRFRISHPADTLNLDDFKCSKYLLKILTLNNFDSKSRC